jgi:hypothetical protein
MSTKIIGNRAGDKVSLSARSSFGANVLREDGRVWIVRECRARVMGLANKEGVLLESTITGAWRWVRLEKDRDFDIGFLNRN